VGTVELDDRAVNLVLTGRKPFDLLVEGRFLKTSGEDRTPFELFIAGVRDWEADLRQYFPRKSKQA
jgi:hypothetical protein